MEGLKSSLFCLVIFTLFAYGSNQIVENVCRSALEIPCDDTQCILRSQWCDGTKDCRDKSDEKYCKLATTFTWYPNKCDGNKHFYCGDGRCFPAAVRCDNINDCSDFSDEENCETSSVAEEMTAVKPGSEDASQKANAESSENDDKVSIHPSSNPRSDVRAISEYGSTDHYEYRRNQSSDHLNERTNRNGRYSHQDRQGYDKPDDSYYYRRHGRYENNGHYRAGGPVNGPPIQPHPSSYNYPPVTQPVYDPELIPDYQTTPRYQAPPQLSDSSTQRSGLTLIPPRSVLYPPELRPSQSNRNRKPLKPASSPFYFKRNYTLDTEYEYSSAISRAKDWILSKRNHLYSWGEDTPRALTALSLITNSFSANISENDLMRKSLKTHLGLKLLRNNTGIEKMSTTRLAMYIHALLATCLDPRDFWGMDLTEILHSRKNYLEPDQTFVNPLVYLSLCLTDQPISQRDMQELRQMLVSRFPDEVSKDLHILATISLACFHQYYVDDSRFGSMLSTAFEDLLTQKNSTDGSFGSIYSTALAAQAFMSSNVTSNVFLRDTLRTLADSQLDDGSFGDMQATYYIVLALSGRSLLHLRNTQCDRVESDETPKPPPDCPKKKVFLTLRVGNPDIFATSIQLTMCDGANAFEAMRIAADLDPRFKFHYKITNDQLGVHTIANVPSDAERGLYWNLYVLQTTSDPVDIRNRYTRDIRELIPRDGAELLYWYLPIQLN